MDISKPSISNDNRSYILSHAITIAMRVGEYTAAVRQIGSDGIHHPVFVIAPAVTAEYSLTLHANECGEAWARGVTNDPIQHFNIHKRVLWHLGTVFSLRDDNTHSCFGSDFCGKPRVFRRIP